MQKRISKILLFFFLLFDIIYAKDLDLFSDKYILYNLSENQIMMKKDENVKTNIASLTKIMTIIVSIENIKDFEEEVIITKQMLDGIASDVSVAGFKKGERLTYNDLLYGAMLPSGADATNALAISIAGTKENFIKLMNDKVKELHLKNTHFSNVVGLYDEDNYSSAYDIAQLLMYSLKNKKFKEIFETKKYTLTNGKELKSTLLYYENDDVNIISGSKTGYIKAAGRCLASTSQIDDVNYLLITLNSFSKDKTAHIKDAITIYSYYKENYAYHNYLNIDDVLVTLNTENAKEKQIEIKSNEIKKIYHDNTFSKDKLEYIYNGKNEVSYFTKKGTKLGTITIKYDNEIIDNFDLIYNETLTFSLINTIKNYLAEIILLIFASIIIMRKKIYK